MRKAFFFVAGVMAVIGCNDFTNNPNPELAGARKAKADTIRKDTATVKPVVPQPDTAKNNPPKTDTIRRDTVKPKPVVRVDSSECYACTKNTLIEADTSQPRTVTDRFILCKMTEAEVRAFETKNTGKAIIRPTETAVPITHTYQTTCRKYK